MITAAELKPLGLTDKEAKFYLAALELGQFSLVGIAQKTGLKRPTCYLIAEELAKKGLLTEIPRSKKKLYIVEAPEKILENLSQAYELAKSFLPDLNKLLKKNSSIPTIRFFKGQEGAKNIYADALASKPKEVLSIFSPTDIFDVVGRPFTDLWVAKRVAKKIGARSILASNSLDKIYEYKNDSKLFRQIKYLPENIDIPGGIMIYKNKVAFISSNQDNFSFLVTSDEFQQTIKGIFDILWNHVAKNKI